MDSHARSLLERLNTSVSPKVSKAPTPEAKASPSLPAHESKDADSSETMPPSLSTPRPNQRSSSAALQGLDATMSVKDLLVSARHRSRETSENDSNIANPPTAPNNTGAADGSIATDPNNSITAVSEVGSRKLVINTSDGDSSGLAEEMPTTPGGSNNSSLASSGGPSRNVSETASSTQPQGVRVNCAGPSLVMLPRMNPHLPRLQNVTDDTGRIVSGEGIGQIANISRTFGHHDRDIIGATTKYIVYALKDGRIRIIDQNTGTRALAETPSTAPVISLSVRDGDESDDSYLLVLDAAHDLTIWSIKPWKVDSANVPLDYLIRIKTAGRKVDQSFPPIAKWWPRYANCLAVCTGLSVCIYVFHDTQAGQNIDISGDKEHAVSIPVGTGVRDFCFSADGSALAVLDFHGDVLFWPLCSDSAFSEFYDTSRLNQKLTFSNPSIKFTLPMDLNPCSIQFMDFDTENDKASFTPLFLVGSSNNRRLHLVDLSGGTVLQELRLPSFNDENLPLQNFSMIYTEEKRFLVIGDDLSNSIYFLHLSLPERPSSTIRSQSDFLFDIAETNSTKPFFSSENFPVFDYITELPFFKNRKLQALAVTPSLDAFLDVFTAHSEGFTMLSPEKDDILPTNYLDAKIVDTEILPKPKLHREVRSASNKSEDRIGSPRSVSRASSVESFRSQDSKQTSFKKKAMQKATETAVSDAGKAVNTSLATLNDSSPEVSHRESSPAMEEVDMPRSTSSPESHAMTYQERGTGSSNMEVQDLLNQALEQQYQRLLADQKLLTSAADDRHESILKVVSSTLTTNVGKLLEQTVRISIEKSILPAISSTVKKSVDQQLTKALVDPLRKSIPKELGSAVDEAINKALLDKDGEVKFLDTLSQMMVNNLEPLLTKEVSTRFEASMERTLGVMMGKMEERLQSSIEKSLQRIQKENRTSYQDTVKKLDTLTHTLSSITQQLNHNGVQSVSRSTSPPSTASSPLNHLKQKMSDQFKAGNYSEGIETWSDSVDGDQAALFEVLMSYEPSILRGVEQLTLMSAANAISVELKTHLQQRLQWLEKIIALAKLETNPVSCFRSDEQGNYSEYWPRVLGLLDQRLEAAFEEYSSRDRKGPLARMIAVTHYHTQAKLSEFKP